MSLVNKKRVIQKCGVSHKLMTFGYTDSKGIESVRTVEPYEYRGDLFFGYDLAKKEIRRFSLSKMANLKEEVNSSFIPKWPLRFPLAELHDINK